MLKKFFHIAMVMVFAVSSIGITYHYHYCSGQLMAFSILHTPEPCCEHPENCCSDKAVTLQLKTDGLFAADYPDLTVDELILPIPVMEIAVDAPLTVFVSIDPDESPPPTISKRLALWQQYLI